MGGVFCPGGGIDAFKRVLAEVAVGREVFANAIGKVRCQDSGRGVTCRGAGRLYSGPVNVLSGYFPCGVSEGGEGRLFSSFFG